MFISEILLTFFKFNASTGHFDLGGNVTVQGTERRLGDAGNSIVLEAL